jgi:hypothetical protein
MNNKMVFETCILEVLISSYCFFFLLLFLLIGLSSGGVDRIPKDKRRKDKRRRQTRKHLQEEDETIRKKELLDKGLVYACCRDLIFSWELPSIDLSYSHPLLHNILLIVVQRMKVIFIKVKSFSSLDWYKR